MLQIKGKVIKWKAEQGGQHGEKEIKPVWVLPEKNHTAKAAAHYQKHHGKHCSFITRKQLKKQTLASCTTNFSFGRGFGK